MLNDTSRARQAGFSATTVIPYFRFQEYQDRRQMIRDRILVDLEKDLDARAATESSTSPREKKKK